MTDVTFSIRRLQAGDEEVLAELAAREEEFDLEGRSTELAPLESTVATRLLANPSVLIWIAEHDGALSGFLYCVQIPLRAADGMELLLYEIGVQQAHRRMGVGRALLDQMERWMREHGVPEVWVCADNEVAVQFYRAGGLVVAAEQPVYLTKRLI